MPFELVDALIVLRFDAPLYALRAAIHIYIGPY